MEISIGRRGRHMQTVQEANKRMQRQKAEIRIGKITGSVSVAGSNQVHSQLGSESRIVLVIHFPVRVEVSRCTRMSQVWNPDQPQGWLQQMAKSLLKEDAAACHNETPSDHRDAGIWRYGCRTVKAARKKLKEAAMAFHNKTPGHHSDARI